MNAYAVPIMDAIRSFAAFMVYNTGYLWVVQLFSLGFIIRTIFYEEDLFRTLQFKIPQK